VTVCATNVRKLHTWQFKHSIKQDHDYSERLQRTKFHACTWFIVFAQGFWPANTCCCWWLVHIRHSSSPIRLEQVSGNPKCKCTVTLIHSETGARISISRKVAVVLLVCPISIKSTYCAAWAKHGNCLTDNNDPNFWFLVMLLLLVCNALIQLLEDNTVTALNLLRTLANKATSNTS